MNQLETKNSIFYTVDLQHKVSFEDFISAIPKNYNGIVLKIGEKEPTSNSNGNAKWSDVYTYDNSNLSYVGEAIYKEYDYDTPYSAYCEKLWSVLGRLVLDKTRVADIDIIKSYRYGDTEIISHKILDSNTEEAIDFYTLGFHKFSREELTSMHSVFYIEDLLECIRLEVKNEENYKQVEQQTIETVLLDSATNNVDRHPANWMLIRNKEDNWYSLGLFDHSLAFSNMIAENPFASHGIWAPTYLKTNKMENWNMKNITREYGDSLVNYIIENYKTYYEDFMEKMEQQLPTFIEFINNSKYKHIAGQMMKKRKHMNKILDEGGISYE